MNGFKQAFRKGIPGMLAEIADLLRQILDDQRAYHQYMIECARRAEVRSLDPADPGAWFGTDAIDPRAVPK